MKAYSFTKPKKKSVFKEDTKLWLILIFISLGLYIAFSLFLTLKAFFLQKDANELKQKTASLIQNEKTLNSKKDFIYTQKALYEDIQIKNQLTKQQIKNLLDLIPDPITLERFYIDDNKLIIYGITPTKDVYNMLMLPPLKSIFTKTVTTFYELPNGWFRFKSENYIKSENED